MKKNKSIRTIKVGKKRGVVTVLWSILIFSMVFAVYKNFTAIDKHTTKETQVVNQEIIDTNNVESYVKNFARVYYSWEQNPEYLENRSEVLKNYLLDELIVRSSDMIRSDIPTSSVVENVEIMSVTEKNDNIFEIVFIVGQTITESEVVTTLDNSYVTQVYVESKNSFVIVMLPTSVTDVSKSSYTPQKVEFDVNIPQSTVGEINDTLGSFFTMYPKATEKEIAYYVENNELGVISKDFVFVELDSVLYKQEDDVTSVLVYVKYIDNETKTIQTFEYDLEMKKDDNWKIIHLN